MTYKSNSTSCYLKLYPDYCQLGSNFINQTRSIFQVCFDVARCFRYCHLRCMSSAFPIQDQFKPSYVIIQQSVVQNGSYVFTLRMYVKTESSVCILFRGICSKRDVRAILFQQVLISLYLAIIEIAITAGFPHHKQTRRNSTVVVLKSYHVRWNVAPH